MARLARRALPAALALLLAAAAAGPAVAEEQDLSLSYRIYVGGFRTVDMGFDTTIGPDAYALKLKFDARGVIDWFFTWSMVAASEGRLDGGRVVPLRASTDSRWSGRSRRIDIRFPAHAAPVATVRPTEEDGRREPVPDALRRGTRDLAGAIIAALGRIGETGNCNHAEKVFDGRRRYDLRLSHLGTERLAPSDYSAFSGEAIKCRLSIARIAGFRKTRSRFGWARSDDATVWLARLFPGTRPVPVRIEHETLFGELRGHLAGATLTRGGRVRRIAISE